MSDETNGPRRSDADLNDELTALIRPGATSIPGTEVTAPDLSLTTEDARLETVQLLGPEGINPQLRALRPEIGREAAPAASFASPGAGNATPDTPNTSGAGPAEHAAPQGTMRDSGAAAAPPPEEPPASAAAAAAPPLPEAGAAQPAPDPAALPWLVRPGGGPGPDAPPDVVPDFVPDLPPGPDWGPLPDLPDATAAPEPFYWLPLATIDAPPPTAPHETGPEVAFAPTTLTLAPMAGDTPLVAPAGAWFRPEVAPIADLAALGIAPPLGVALPSLPPAPPPLPGPVAFAPPLDLPAPPIPEAFRPTLRASGGTIVTNSVGEVVNAPTETQVWNYLDPFGGERRGLTPEHVNGTTRINNLTLQNDHPVSVTFIGEGAGHRNTLGYYKIGPDGTIGDVRVIWADASGAREAAVLDAWRAAGADPADLDAIRRAYSSINEGGSQIAGISTVTLDNLQAGDSFGFFLVSNGFNNTALRQAMLSDGAEFSFRTATGAPAAVTPGISAPPRLHFDYTDAAGVPRSGSITQNIFHSAANGDTLGLNSSGKQQVISGVVGEDTGSLGPWGVQSGDLLIGFEDLPRPSGDSDFNDLVFRLNVGPAFVETLDKVSNMPVVTAGTVAGADPITRAVASFDALDGISLHLAGVALAPGGGMVDFGGQRVGYSLDRAADGTGAVLVFEAPDGMPAELASGLLSALEFAPLEGDARAIPAGDRLIAFQLATDSAESDIVQAVVRVAHNPAAPVNPVPSTVIAQGPSNVEIAARNAAAEAAFANEVARVTAANTALAAAEAELRAAHDAAATTEAALQDAHAALEVQLATAEGALARLDAAADTLAEAEVARALPHAAARAAHAAATDAATAEAAAAAQVEGAEAQLALAHQRALVAAGEMEMLEQVAWHTHAAATEALADLAAQATLAQAAAAEANALRTALDAAEIPVQAAAAAASVAHARAEAATIALRDAQEGLADLAAAAAADHARMLVTRAEAETARADLEEGRATVEALDAVRQAAHADWMAFPQSATAQAAFEQAEAAHAGAAAAHLHAREAWEPLEAALADAVAQQAASLAAFDDAVEAARPRISALAEAQAAHVAAARAATAALAEAQVARDSAAAAHEAALEGFATQEAAALSALADAEVAAAAQAAAASAHAEALAAFEAGPLANLATARDAVDAATAHHAQAAEAREAAIAALDSALAADAAAEATWSTARDAAVVAQAAAEQAAATADAMADAAELAHDAHGAALARLSASADAYAETAATHGITLPQAYGGTRAGFLDVDHPAPDGGADAPEGAGALFDFADADGAGPDPGGPGGDPFDPAGFDPATLPHAEDPGYDGLA